MRKQERIGLWQEGFEYGKVTGTRFRGSFGPVVRGRNRRDDLIRDFSEVMTQHACGVRVSPDSLRALRRLAVAKHRRDWDGVSLAVVSTLATAFDNAPARAWLPVMLASAGMVEETLDAEPDLIPRGPSGADWLVVVTALEAAGYGDRARRLAETLKERSPEVSETCVTTWGETPLSRAFARLRGNSPITDELPVFFHLPFCGGTSTIVSFKRIIPWIRIAEIGRRRGLLQIEQLLEMPAGEVEKLLLVHQHHPFAFRLPGRKHRYFTILRDPVSQLRSGYFKRWSTPGILPTRDESSTFTEHARYTIDNRLTNMLARQVVTTHPDLMGAYEKQFTRSGAYDSVSFEEDMFWLSATAKLKDDTLLRMCRETLDEQFFSVGTMKHLEASHLAATAAVGVNTAERLPHRGRSGQPEREIEDLRTTRQLREANSVDAALYEEYTARFEAQHSGLIDVLSPGAGSGST
ncbi:hypothetical protein GCM10027059_46980 [Myceligenerans halotolerans]